MIDPSGQQKALWREHYNAVRQARNLRNGCLNTLCRRRQASKAYALLTLAFVPGDIARDLIEVWRCP
ncbi:hypothetical protein [Pseudomonas peradeniyensis]|uniref:Uncharacterized protein n=1 Tax=Pseudomonas peradeniyensis TaxID=2745488 RepID=A0ABT2VB84_9PSED|nr:hypothetical protein [Pseudomonas peradeniyensis]MCU7238732.1 hypothetical protein [Pseudomonas peradeniyensis]